VHVNVGESKKVASVADMDAILKQLKEQENSFTSDETVYSKATTTTTSSSPAATTVKAPTHQVSTIGYLFGFFGLIFLVSYLVHRAGGPHQVELAIDRFYNRAKSTLIGSKGGYSRVNHGSTLPR
jgi:hypothetical protein